MLTLYLYLGLTGELKMSTEDERGQNSGPITMASTDDGMVDRLHRMLTDTAQPDHLIRVPVVHALAVAQHVQQSIVGYACVRVGPTAFHDGYHGNRSDLDNEDLDSDAVKVLATRIMTAPRRHEDPLLVIANLLVNPDVPFDIVWGALCMMASLHNDLAGQSEDVLME
ncbi:hypothetical protein FRB99_001108 [Tulasnella sp. 403]|nr:hypothetical protein FRB99_001108 [Tulasnella sp. 403]